MIFCLHVYVYCQVIKQNYFVLRMRKQVNYVPIVTLGIGSLAEKVEHNISGFIAKNKFEYAYYTLKLFSDDNLWQKQRNNLIKEKEKKYLDKSC